MVEKFDGFLKLKLMRGPDSHFARLTIRLTCSGTIEHDILHFGAKSLMLQLEFYSLSTFKSYSFKVVHHRERGLVDMSQSPFLIYVFFLHS